MVWRRAIGLDDLYSFLSINPACGLRVRAFDRDTFKAPPTSSDTPDIVGDLRAFDGHAGDRVALADHAALELEAGGPGPSDRPHPRAASNRGRPAVLHPVGNGTAAPDLVC